MADYMIDLGHLSGDGRVRNLSGKERGVLARKELGVDRFDVAPGTVEVIIPEYIDAISPSYFQGLFSQSIARLNGRDAFLSKYKFKGSKQALEWVRIGIRNATISRAPLI